MLTFFPFVPPSYPFPRHLGFDLFPSGSKLGYYCVDSLKVIGAAGIREGAHCDKYRSSIPFVLFSSAGDGPVTSYGNFPTSYR